MTKTKLPNKLSELIRVALKDLTWAEKQKNIEIDMSDFVDVITKNGNYVEGTYSALSKGKEIESCAVCFAGAVMIKSLDALIDGNGSQDISSSVGEKNYGKVTALDWVRTGSIRAAVEQFYWDYEKNGYTIKGTKASDKIRAAGYEFTDVAQYELDKKAWRKDMLKIANKLERLGL